MKKIIIFLIVLFISVFKSEATSKFYLGEKLPMYIKAYDNNNIYTRSPYILTREDDSEFVYCINPFQLMNTKNYYNEYDYNNSKFDLTNEQLDKINLIAYFGYQYKNHTDTKWYGITQLLIWKELNLDDVYFTDSNYNKIDIYESEIKEIENLVNNYYKLPSFANSVLEYSSNNTYKLIDNNNVLQNYELLNTNIDIKVIDNELIINTKDDGIYNIEFIKRSPIESQYKLYSLDGFQSLLYPGKINDIKFNLTIEVNSGNITINKFDSENVNRLDAKLSGAVYGIYDSDQLITTVETNENGIAYIKDLPLGTYYVKEITPSIGYLLDNNIYEVNIIKDNKNIIINSYEDVIKGNLVINKYYLENDNYKLEDGAVFEIYDSNDNLVDTIKTDYGVVIKYLPYGNYTITQKKGLKGYKYIENFNVFINDEKDYTFNLYDEKVLVVEVPNTGIYVKKRNNISLIFIILGIIILVLNKIKNKKITID